MKDICLNCGARIRTMIFKGRDWCSDDCRKVLLGIAKCSYEPIWTDEVGEVDVCVVHGHDSYYNRRYGPTRPCRAVEDPEGLLQDRLRHAR